MISFENNPKINERLVSCLRDWGIESLTDVQAQAIDADVALGASAIVCAPTSSGKTLIGELALASALASGLDALYLVSHKALADQKFADFIKKFSGGQWTNVTIGISTGDREEGDVNARLLISTYEKALGLLLAGRLKISKTVVIADELQILGEDTRGPSVEVLCALLRQRQPHQFVGLTATLENPEALAAWMNCQVVRSGKRDIDLIQMVRYGGKLYKVKLGYEDVDAADDPFGERDLHDLIRKTLNDGLGPVLVFTETRREALELAAEYSEKAQRSAEGLLISQQLELFSEPTESSQHLRSQAERRVTFHTADLTPDERTVIEEGFVNSSFDVCFATSTLAAGVNFPFRTVIIPKLTYQYGGREGRRFSRSHFRNMSGRAGRLGYHDDGYVILMPSDKGEFEHAKRLVMPTNDRVESQLMTVSMRRTVLSLVASHAVSSKADLTAFFQNTFYWHEILENNPKLLETVVAKAETAIEWLLANGFVEESHSTINPTPLGKLTSLSGLLPQTAKQFVDLLAEMSAKMEANFAEYEIGLIHWVLTCPEFMSTTPTRLLAWPSGHMKPESSAFVGAATHLTAWDRTNDRVTRCVHALALFIDGLAERKIAFATGISAGYLHRLSIDVSWILDGLRTVSGASDLACPQTLTNEISMLARRVRWGTPAEALDVLRIARRKSVPGFGRQRVMALLTNGFTTVMDVLTAAKDQLIKLLDSEKRADALVAALSDTLDVASAKFERMHVELGAELGIREKVLNCNDALGTDYEDAICALLKEEINWTVDKLDDGKRQNVPDIQLKLGETALLIECKTVTKKPPLVAKEDAFAILQKAADFAPEMKRVTLGKPDFDETCKKKAAASSSITLVQHAVFMEGLMRVLTGRLMPGEFVAWLAEPGVSDLARLSGSPTYVPLKEVDGPAA
ncbi:MAG TPA: DEAD/DEAH box helicase [Pyrinomonadaceae bacterium]